MTTRTIDIAGMHCAACIGRVEKALVGVQGVASANVNLVTNRAVVEISDQVKDENLTRAVESAGYTVQSVYGEQSVPDANTLAKRIEAPAREYRGALLLAAPFAVAIMIISMWAMFSHHAPWVNSLLFVLTLPVLWAGRSFFVGAYKAALHLSATMDTLVSIGTGAAFIASVAAASDVYYDSTSTIISLVLLGKWLEVRAKGRTAEALQSLMELHPKVIRVRRDGIDIDVPAADVVTGETIVLRPGERVPTDGVLVSGTTTTDESMITGESLPVERGPGETLIGGSLNTTGSVIMRATAVGSVTVLAGIIRAVEKAQSSKAPIQRLADQISSVFVPIVLGIAAITFCVWFYAAPAEIAFNQALTSAIAVLIIACPCALGLATPTAIIVGSGKGASLGVLFSNAESIELLQRVDTVVLDKTGTLTEGAIVVHDAAFRTTTSEELVRRYVEALESGSEHPVAKSLVEWAGITPSERMSVVSTTTVPGKGTFGSVGEHRIRIGSESFMEESLLLLQADMRKASAQNDDHGWSSLFISVDGVIVACIAVADTLRSSSADAVARMKTRGLTVIMATGDREAPARAIAASAGISNVLHSVTPHAKAAAVEKLQRQGAYVAMIGDGINDAPALAQANVGIAMGTGTDIAKSTADITLLRPDLHTFLDAIDVSRATIKTIRQNLFFAFVYNILGIPLAAGLLIPLTGMALSPMIAAAAMALSSGTVVSNSLRLRISR
ncbi:MAG: heavy metal translocating P-type ATPase [Candidatus Kapabacteria bacterium]|nr:heavy metal translocating P-type ATPase [Candidatus Kapabacteria bacterium]